MPRPLATALLALAVTMTLGCTNLQGDTPAAIEIGTPYDDALILLDNWGARPTQLAMAPPRRSDGSYMELACFTLDDDRAISIVFDPRRGNTIVSMSQCNQMSDPKASREWRAIDRYPGAR